MTQSKNKGKKIENIKDQIAMTLALLSAEIGSKSKGKLSEEFLQDFITAFDLMNFDFVLEMLHKRLAGKYDLKKHED